jgi:hypothetical protein
MQDYAQVGIKHLSPRALRKLSKGGMIRVQEGEMLIHMSPQKVKKLVEKFKKGKGGMISLDQSEMGMNGEGLFKSVKKGVKKLAKKAKDYVTSTQFKKDLVNMARPTAKGAVQAGIGSLAAAALATNPELAPIIVPAAYAASYGANKLIDKPSYITGDKTYDQGQGIYAGSQRGRGIYAGAGMHVGSQGRGSLLGTHPALQPLEVRHSQHFNQQLKQYM